MIYVYVFVITYLVTPILYNSTISSALYMSVVLDDSNMVI